MTPAWMLATAVVTLLLTASAFALVRVVALYRGRPLRWVWMLATLASFGVAGSWLRPTQPRELEDSPILGQAPDAPTAARVRAGVAGEVTASRVTATIAEPRFVRAMTMASFRLRMPEVSPALSDTLRLTWLLMSLALVALLGLAVVRLGRERSRWRAQEIGGVAVLVSPEFGPALVGVVRPRIVVPEWVLSLDASAQRAIVTHEVEHRDARDPMLMLVGMVAIVAMPWNPGLWLSWRGLRRAIELDCDERVIRRGVDGGEYARVLLHAWKTARGSWLASTAFAERASGLGARVEHLMRPEPRRRAMRTLLGTGVAAGLLAVASVTPTPQFAQSPSLTRPYPLIVIDGVRHPELPPLMRFTGPVKVDTLTTPTYRIVYSGRQAVDTAARKLYPSLNDGTMMQTIDAPASVAHFGPAATYGVVLYYTPKYRAAGGAIIAPQEGSRTERAADPTTPASHMTGVIYDDLFNGIALPADRTAQAKGIIEASNARQLSLKGPSLAIWPLRISTIAERDAQLRALLTTDADRAKFDRRASEGRPSRGPSQDDIVVSEYGNLFGYPREGIATSGRVSLPPGKQEAARAIIRTHLNEELALYARAPGAWTDNYDQRVALRMKRDAELRSLLASESDREAFDRIATRLRDMTLRKS